MRPSQPGNRQARSRCRSARRKGRWNRPRPGSDLQQPTVSIVPHHHPGRVARNAPTRFRGNVSAVFEDRLPRLIGIREHRSIDMDHHLVALARSAGIQTVVERRLGEQRQRIGLQLGKRRRLFDPLFLIAVRAAALIERLTSRLQRAKEECPGFWLQTAPNGHRAVIVLIDVQRSHRVPPRRLLRLRQAIDAAPRAHDPFSSDVE